MPLYEFKCTVFEDCPTDERRYSFKQFEELKDLQVCSCCAGEMRPVVQATPFHMRIKDWRKD